MLPLKTCMYNRTLRTDVVEDATIEASQMAIHVRVDALSRLANGCSSP